MQSEVNAGRLWEQGLTSVLYVFYTILVAVVAIIHRWATEWSRNYTEAPATSFASYFFKGPIVFKYVCGKFAIYKRRRFRPRR